MNTAQTVDNLILQWQEQGIQKTEFVWKLAEACLGWPYIFGARGEQCTPETRRKYYNNYINSKPAEAEQIKKRCQVMSGKASCSGCPYYPNGTTRSFDCRGFTYWVLKQIGIIIDGAGCTSQWNNDANWEQKGRIEDLPAGQLALFFHQNQSDHKTMEHTGFILNGITIHCSGTVKRENASKKITHYAIPKGLGGDIPVGKPTLKRGDKGQYVTLAQTKLIQRGYDCGRWGADGAFGSATESAVKRFQRDSGLTADGVIGPATWDALDAKIALYTVTVQHLSRTVAEEIVGKYGGSMTEEADA